MGGDVIRDDDDGGSTRHGEGNPLGCLDMGHLVGLSPLLHSVIQTHPAVFSTSHGSGGRLSQVMLAKSASLTSSSVDLQHIALPYLAITHTHTSLSQLSQTPHSPVRPSRQNPLMDKTIMISPILTPSST